VTDKRFFKPNPPTGSSIFYFLKNETPEKVKIEILDITGSVIRNLEGPKEKGMNTVFWDFRQNPPENQEGTSAQRRFRRIPMVGPGQYIVRLTAGDTVLTTKLIVEKDNPFYLGR